MNPDPLVRYLQRLPTLITFFFSVMLVTFFRELGSTLHWSTAPDFDIGNPAHVLIVISFVSTLFFVVTVWLAYSLLIERFPYTLDYSVFLFDVARFSLLYMIFNFSFLAGNPPQYVNYIFLLVLWHVMMAGWHAYRLRHIQGAEQAERMADIREHGIRASTYLLLTLIYYFAVTRRWETAQPWVLYFGLVVLTNGLLVYWNATRMSQLRNKAMGASKAALAAHGD